MSLADQMTDSFYRQNSQRFHYMFPNCYSGDGAEMDIMGVRPSRYVDEIEIKISKSDFNADFKKTVLMECGDGKSAPFVESKSKHEMLREGRLTPNRFWFFVPDELSVEIAVPSYAGLMILTKMGIREVHPAPLLHKRKLNVDDIHRLTKNMMFRFWKLRIATNFEQGWAR